jgi:hypothetical protein
MPIERPRVAETKWRYRPKRDHQGPEERTFDAIDVGTATDVNMPKERA